MESAQSVFHSHQDQLAIIAPRVIFPTPENHLNDYLGVYFQSTHFTLNSYLKIISITVTLSLVIIFF